MKIIGIEPPNRAVVEADGMTLEVSLMLTEKARVGDYVLVHTGFALEVMDPAEAEQTLEAISQLSGVMEDLDVSGRPEF